MTPEQMIFSFFGALLSGLGGFAIHRFGKVLDKIDDMDRRLARIEGELRTSDARWESLMNGQSSPSGRYPLTPFRLPG